MSKHLRSLKKLKRRIILTWISLAVAMVMYPMASQSIGSFPLWVIGWVVSLIGYWAWCKPATQLTEVLSEEIEELEKEEKERQS